MGSQSAKILKSILVSLCFIFLFFFSQAAKCQSKPWSAIVGANRFVVLSEFSDLAVLDRVTGLIWERAPSPNPLPNSVENHWTTGQFLCQSKVIDHKGGWRMPKIEELSSLLDTSNSNPALPTGHPFQNIVTGAQFQGYWAATLDPGSPELAYQVAIGTNGDISASNPSFNKSNLIWCVRGGTN